MGLPIDLGSGGGEASFASDLPRMSLYQASPAASLVAIFCSVLLLISGVWFPRRWVFFIGGALALLGLFGTFFMPPGDYIYVGPFFIPLVINGLGLSGFVLAKQWE